MFNLNFKDIFFIILILVLIFLGSSFLFGEDVNNIVRLINEYPRVEPSNGVLINQQDSYIIHLGYLGSFLQGSIGLIVSVVIMFSVLLTFMIERNRISSQRLEDRFFKLLEIHRENVKGMRISHKGFDCNNENGFDIGDKAVLSIFRELFSINSYVYKEVDKKFFTKHLLTQKERLQLSYIILFFGFGRRSNNVVCRYLSFLSYKIDLDKLKEKFTDNDCRKEISKLAPIKYKSIGGHQTRLGHYFRNLFFCVKRIDNDETLTFEEKLEYIKHLRVQLNTYEQILLLVNSLTFLGVEWEKYIVLYQLVKNIPYGMLDDKKELNVERHIAELCKKYQKDIFKYYKRDWESFSELYFEYEEYRDKILR